MKNRSDNIDRVLQAWMADGPAAIPDRVVDVVAARIGIQRQRRTWLFPGRSNVNTQIKLIAALAAALVVAVVGYNLLPGTSGPGAPTIAPTPSAQPTDAPTNTPSAAAVCPTWFTDGCGDGAGILTAGSHTTQSFVPSFTFRVPEGWVNDGDSAGIFGLFPDDPANQAEFTRSGSLLHSIFLGPHPSPYFICESVENNAGANAAEMVAALVANEAAETTGLVDVEIGGLTGKQFDVRLNPEWTGTCPPSPDEPPGFNIADQRTRAFLLDAPDLGVIVMFVGSSKPADHEAFLAEAMPIIESFEFDLGQ
jgi:hypothetical protein